MTTKIIGGTVRDIAGTPVENAEVTIELLTKVAFRISDSGSIAPEVRKFTIADGTWSTTVECNDTITPTGTLYRIKETYAAGITGKIYLIQVLSTLGAGTNQVLDLIVPEMSPIGIVNNFLTKAFADTLYAPISGGSGVGGLTDAELRASPVPVSVSGSVGVTGPLTDTQLRATAVPVSGPLTDAQIRATPLVVTGGGAGIQYTEGDVDTTITGTAVLWEDSGDVLRAASAAKPLPVSLGNSAVLADGTIGSVSTVGAELMSFNGASWDRARGDIANGIDVDVTRVSGNVAVTGPLTDTQLRATPVPVSGTVSVGTVPVTGPLTDTQLRASAVPVSLASVPSHAVTNAGTFAVQADTELGSAVAVGDGVATPTAPIVYAGNILFNGTTWDRFRGDVANGLDVDVTRVSGTVAVSGPLTDTQLRATAVPISGALTDAQLRATPVPVTGGGGGIEYTEDVAAAADPIGSAQMLVRKDTPAATVTTDGDNIAQRGNNFGAAYVTVLDSSGAFAGTGLTDAQLRATPVPVTGGGGGTEYTEGATDATITGSAILWEDTADTLRAVSVAKPLPVAVQGTVPVSGPLTDIQLRATPVPVSGTVSVGTVPVTGPLTDTQLRASAVPISVATIPVHGITDNAGSLTVDAPVGTPVFVRLSDGTAAIATLPVSLATLPALAAGTANIGDVDVLTLPANASVNQTQINGVAVSVGSGVNGTGVQRVTIATDQAAITCAEEKVSSASVTQVAVSTTNAVLKASNTSRKYLTVFNDAATVLCVKYGATASATSFTVKIPAGAIWEMAEVMYTGTVDAVLVSGTGNAYVTEL